MPTLHGLARSVFYIFSLLLLRPYRLSNEDINLVIQAKLVPFISCCPGVRRQVIQVGPVPSVISHCYTYFPRNIFATITPTVIPITYLSRSSHILRSALLSLPACWSRVNILLSKESNLAIIALNWISIFIVDSLIWLILSSCR
ncbi:hypothetical protein D3C85_1464510 [compost metagenome]